MTCKDGRFNTGNKICSSDPRDLHDDVMIIDAFTNSDADFVEDRFGVERKTISGIEKQANDAIDGFEDLITQRINEKIIAQGGVEIINDWDQASDENVFSAGFVSKRINQDADGNTIIKSGAQTFTFPKSSGEVKISEDIPNTNSTPFEEINSKTTASIAVVNGETVNTRLLSNIYINGTLKHDGYDFIPLLSENMLLNQSRSNTFGGQLKKLKNALSNPLNQKMNVKFLGDSNTWGSGTRQNASFTPRSGKLTDARDHFKSNSYVNLFKRYIGMRYFDGVNPVLSNYHSSPSGESIASFSKAIMLFPYEGSLFKYNYMENVGGYITKIGVDERDGTILGCRLIMTHGKRIELVSRQSLEFKFTGDSFNLYYTKAANCQNLLIEVDGEVVDTINAYSETTLRGEKYVVNFNYIKGKTIKLIPDSGETEVSNFYIEGIEILKEVNIHNDAIIGNSVGTFVRNSLDKINEPEDCFYIVSYGGNDRRESVNSARSISTFYNNLDTMINKFNSLNVDTIIMTTTPGVVSENEFFTRQEAANALVNYGYINKIDVIDNHSVLLGTDPMAYSTDGTHMNIYANAVVARNIITSLENS